MIDDEDDDLIPSGHGIGSRAHVGAKRVRHRGEGRCARAGSAGHPITPRMRKALARIYDLVTAGSPVRLADVNRAMGEPPDFAGGWPVLRALRDRGLVSYASTKLGTMTLPDVKRVRKELGK